MDDEYWEDALRMLLEMFATEAQQNPEVYWHSDDEFAAFMDVVLEPVEL